MPKEPFREHALRVNSLFQRISGVYDLLNTVLSLGMHKAWRARLAEVAAPFPESGAGRLLDVAAGTLDVSLALARRYPGHTVLALDFCRPMLLQGLPKLERAGTSAVVPLTGDGSRLPLAAGSVDAVTMAFGLRNIRPRSRALEEALRVLSPGGRLCVLEFAGAQEPILFGLYNVYLTRVLPAVGRLVSRDREAYRYLADTITEFPLADALSEEMLDAGFVSVFHETMAAGIVNLHVAVKGRDPDHGEPPVTGRAAQWAHGGPGS